MAAWMTRSSRSSRIVAGTSRRRHTGGSVSSSVTLICATWSPEATSPNRRRIAESANGVSRILPSLSSARAPSPISSLIA